MTVKIDKKIVSYEIGEKTEKVETVSKNVKVKKRPVYLPGGTYKLKSPHYKHAFYVTVNKLDGKLFEIFINTRNKESGMWSRTTTRSWSATFRVEDDVQFLVSDMMGEYDEKGGHFAHGKYHNSIVAEIGYILDRIINMDGRLGKVVENSNQVGMEYLDLECPECSEKTMRMVDGCPTCNCGYSKCG